MHLVRDLKTGNDYNFLTEHYSVREFGSKSSFDILKSCIEISKGL